MIVSNTIRKPDGLEMRIVDSKPPTENAIAVIPTLEDAYLYYTRSDNFHKEGS